MLLKCDNCGYEFNRRNSNVKLQTKNHFCCRKCFQDFKNKTSFIDIPCGICGNLITMKKSRYNRSDRTSKQFFCSKSCIGKNANKFIKKSRRSKLERFLEENLKINYGWLDCKFNDRSLGLELDIYIPSLRLAFEFNGPLHYRPIYGEEKMLYIKANDEKKNNICESLGIKLHTLDVSNGVKTRELEQRYYDLITTMMESSLLDY